MVSGVCATLSSDRAGTKPLAMTSRWCGPAGTLEWSRSRPAPTWSRASCPRRDRRAGDGLRGNGMIKTTGNRNPLGGRGARPTPNTATSASATERTARLREYILAAITSSLKPEVRVHVRGAPTRRESAVAAPNRGGVRVATRREERGRAADRTRAHDGMRRQTHQPRVRPSGKRPQDRSQRARCGTSGSSGR